MKPVKITQTITDEHAIRAFNALVERLEVTPSRLLESLLLAAPWEALQGLIDGSESIGSVRLVSLDVPELLAVTDAVAAGVGALAPRIEAAIVDGLKSHAPQK